MSDFDSLASGANRQGAWHSFDAPYERLRLFSPAMIGGFAAAMGLGLALVFPHKTLEQRLASNNAPADRLTIEYLKAFVRAEPSAAGLRVALARRLISLGSYAEARSALEPLRHHAQEELRGEAAVLELDMLAKETFAFQAGTPQRTAALRQARAHLQAMAQLSLTTPQLVTLSQAALALGDSASAARAFRQMAAGKAELSAQFYAEAAAAMLGMGDYRTCAELYFHAMRESQGLRQKRQYYLQGLRALQAASLFDEALRAAERHIGPLAEDTETLFFLTRLAQAANRPDLAEAYAKRLLRLSLLRALPPMSRLAGGEARTPLEFYFAAWRGDGADAGAPARLQKVANGGDEHGGSQPGLAFDEAAYTLGYEVFLARRNLADAHRLAQSAVRQRPDLPHWRKRLAEVSEWHGAPREALQQWLVYARMSKDEAAWDAVLRLAQSLFDQDALRIALEHKLDSDAGNPAWLEKLLAVHEAEGEPEAALRLLQRRLAAGGHRAPAQRRRELELLADIAQRAGRDEQSLQALETLQAEFGPRSAYALRIANHLYRRGRTGEAFAALERGLAGADIGDADFWRAYAEVARLLQHDEAARAGYRKLLESGRQSEADLSNLIALLDDKPRAAAMVAEFAFDKTGSPAFMIQALGYLSRVPDWEQARRLLARPSAAQLGLLEKSADFLAARAAVLQASSDVRGAIRDLRAALRIRRNDAGLRASLIWGLIAARDTEALKQALDQWAALAESSPQLWGAFAAANMALNRQDVALHWFRKSGFAQNDYLWMMSYAEALDATSQPDLAWRLRRKAWQDLREPGALAAMDAEQLLAARDRLASLAPLFAGGERAQKLMAALLRADVRKLAAAPAAAPAQSGKELLDRLAQADSGEDSGTGVAASASALFQPGGGKRPHDDARLSASVRELALAYALNRDAHDLARAWLATRYASQLAKPLWGELSLLLAAGDRDRLNRLLDELPDWLPMYDRIEAARQAGRPALAQTLAFDQLARLPADEQLHARLAGLATAGPARFRADVRAIRDGALDTDAMHAESSLNLSTGLRLTLALNRNRHRLADSSQLGVVPARDDEVVLAMRKLTETGHLAVSINRRMAAANNTGLRLEYQLSPASRLSLSGSAGLRQSATESALLRAGAMRSGTEHILTYSLTRTEYASLGLSWHRFQTQHGTSLGSGRAFRAELGSHLRLEYPNITLRAHASRYAYATSGRIDEQIAEFAPPGVNPGSFRYLPADATVFGIDLGLGTVAENAYSRGLRPFAELGLSYGQEQGASYNLRGGLSGSLLGQDVLMLRLQRNGASAARPQGLQEFGIHYQWLY